MSYIDLHTHSCCSDGTFSPAKLVHLAKEQGLSAIALTDHDTIAGLFEAVEAGKTEGIEVVPGIEFSTEYHGKDIHIVGLDFEHDSPKFLSQIGYFQDSRKLRNQKMIDLLHDKGGFDISWEQMEESFGTGIWTRAHFGRFLLEKGYVKDISEAFSKYLGDDCPYFIPREKVTPQQAVKLILETGGIPVLAHPLQYHFPDAKLEELIETLKSCGIIGMEAYYSTHTPMEESQVLRLCRIHGLAVSGGSDFHGNNKPSISLGTGRGNLRIPYEILTQLREAARK